MSELKPCPFCGGKATLEDYGLNRNFVAVQCLNCGAKTRLFAKDIHLGETAFDAWNNRINEEKVKKYPWESYDAEKFESMLTEQPWLSIILNKEDVKE